MWKLFAGVSLTVCVCMCVMANDPHPSKPPQPSVSVKCHGRLRHGVVAIGGETTGTTITFNREVYEIALKGDAQRDFAKEHHKGTVTATGTLRKIAGTESGVRWIIDVDQLLERDATQDKEELRLTIQGTLRATAPDAGDSPRLTIEADNQVWPIDFSSDAKLQVKAELLIGQPVLLTGSLEQASEEDSSEPANIRVKTLEQSR